ncbi:MAG: hypothetical protein J6A94_10320 [Lachnospiraceae bacterium]|nr:hypothetical protein [Lachnospiraceae bacterium]
MKKNNKKIRLQAAYILLFFTLIFSQNITWTLIKLLPDFSDPMLSKACPILQTCSATLYILTTIVITSDREVFEAFLERHTIIKLCLEKLIYWAIRILTSTMSFIMFIPDFTSTSPKSTELIVTERKEYSESMFNQFYSSIFEIRLFSGISCIFIIIMILAFFLPTTIVFYIADILSMLVAIIGGIFVANNAKAKIQNS